MIETVTLGIIMVMLMAKKKEQPRKFGQMTLNMGGQALDYLKSDPKGIARNARRVEWMNKHEASSDYELPPWVHPTTDDQRSQYPTADRVQDVAIIHDVDPAVMPLLVHQNTALRGLDAVLAEAQEDGALIEDDGKRLVLDMGEGSLPVRFIRNTKAGRFASFIVRRD